MKSGQVIYNSNEISSIVSKIESSNNTIQNEVKPLISNRFSVLRELDLFSDGLDLLEKEASNAFYLNSNLISVLNVHDADMNEMETKHNSLFDAIADNSEDTNEVIYSGEKVSIDEIVLNKINDGKVILTEYVKEVIPSFSYDRKLEILKSVLNDDPSSLSILTDEAEADILIYQLKNILNEDYSIELSKLTKKEEKEIQKSFFESITDNDTNIFDELGTDSFLGGLPYFEQMAKKKDMTASDIIFNKDNSELFTELINNICNDEEIGVLTDEQVTSVKNYIKNLSETNNIEMSELLVDKNYSSIIKGGIYYGN